MLPISGPQPESSRRTNLLPTRNYLQPISPLKKVKSASVEYTITGPSGGGFPTATMNLKELGIALLTILFGGAIGGNVGTLVGVALFTPFMGGIIGFLLGGFGLYFATR